jgi:hypothetical protein
MTSIQKIESDWNEFRRKPFPESDTVLTEAEDSAFADFTLIDTFAAGCICTFIHSSGRLDKQHYDSLKTCVQDLSVVIKDLKSGPFKARAEELQNLSKSVLDYVDRKLST